MRYIKSILFAILLFFLPQGFLASCNTQRGGASLRFTFDDAANSQAFASGPDTVPIRAQLTTGSATVPNQPQIRLQYRYIAENGAEAPWQDGPTMMLTPEGGGYLAQATLAGIWPTGLDVNQIKQKGSIQLRALAGNQELAISSQYPLPRINPVWVRVASQPSDFRSLAISDNMVCGAGATLTQSGVSEAPFALCTDKQNARIFAIHESGKTSEEYLHLAIGGDGTVYALPDTGPIKAFKDGSYRSLLIPRGLATALAVDGQALYVGGALDKTNGGCPVKRLYVDRYNLTTLQREASLEFDATEAQENPSLCGTNNSSPALLKADEGRLYMVYGLRIWVYFGSDGTPVALSRLGIAALNALTLSPIWVSPPGGNWDSGGTCTPGSLCGWAQYWYDPNNPCTGTTNPCEALAHNVSGFELDLDREWLWASKAPRVLNPRTGDPKEDALDNRFMILIGETPFGFDNDRQTQSGTTRLSLNTQALQLRSPRYVVIGREEGLVSQIRRYRGEVYAVGRLGNKGFIARLH